MESRGRWLPPINMLGGQSHLRRWLARVACILILHNRISFITLCDEMDAVISHLFNGPPPHIRARSGEVPEYPSDSGCRGFDGTLETCRRLNSMIDECSSAGDKRQKGECLCGQDMLNAFVQ
jgi:hypothetical protein